MWSWLMLHGGMAIWALHFGGVYLIASIFDVVSDASAPASLWASGAWTVVCATANAALLSAILLNGPRKECDPVRDWVFSVSALLAGISLLAVVWQGLPVLWVWN